MPTATENTPHTVSVDAVGSNHGVLSAFIHGISKYASPLCRAFSNNIMTLEEATGERTAQCAESITCKSRHLEGGQLL